jgi:hypothetical protein
LSTPRRQSNDASHDAEGCREAGAERVRFAAGHVAERPVLSRVSRMNIPRRLGLVSDFRRQALDFSGRATS